MAIPKTLRVVILRACLVGTQDAAPGDVFEVSRNQAAVLVGDGLARLLEPGRPNYSVTVEQADHGDPVARKISSGPPQVTEKAGAKKD